MFRLVASLALVSVVACTSDSDDYLVEPPAAIDETADGKTDGTWESVESLDGMPGTFSRGAFGLLPLLALRLEGTAGDDSEGTYEAWWRVGFAGSRFETGRYSSVPENAAIGFAALTLIPDGGSHADGHIYAITRIQREGAVISKLELQRIEPLYLSSTMYRVAP